MTLQDSKHIAYLDILRVLATFGVIFIHVTADGLILPMTQFNWHLAVVGDSLVRRAVALVLAGMETVLSASIAVSIGSFDNVMISYLSVNVAMMSMAIFVFVKENLNKIQPRISKFVDYVRYDLFGIYLVHPMWLMVVNKDVFRDLCTHAISLPIICIVAFFLSLYATKFLRKIPFLKRIVE